MRRGAGPGATDTSLVVGLDRSPASERALEVAADLAVRLDARVHVVHVLELDDHPVDPDRPDDEEEVERRLAEERELATSLLGERVRAWTYRLLQGEPAAALLAVADEVDARMLIVGATRQGWGDHLLHPAARSTGQKLLSRGVRPVLMVPGASPASSRTASPSADAHRADGEQPPRPSLSLGCR